MGRNVETHSNWNDEISATMAASGGARNAAWINGIAMSPAAMLPATYVSTPAAFSISPKSTVVVVLPFVPVIARIGARAMR